ncbi:hypothetical protein pEaSNUABM40_00019 [Erwinia phage pEa_SNUABM_40]|nr:hypothetical protein pEaSNUABM40_00019 [Erwinia phage pEa_SNUABM_40]UAW52801.1 hypothetical protein pEaSNUABM23_00019 [Erwinia phage pEa_SNUABM_23]UIW10697.1 hypothetical protein pEaSNUABM23_00019 [Erwinia phage pEa_SNUABM_31]
MIVLIDNAALASNAAYLKSLAPTMIPVVKGNFYGHGLDCVTAFASDFDVLAVHNVREALTLRELGLDHTLLILGGTDARMWNIVPVLNAAQASTYEGQYAVFADWGCRRINVSPGQLTSRPALVLIHSEDYRQPVSAHTANEIAVRYNMPRSRLSVGSSMNALTPDAPKLMPRVGMALTGYSSDETVNGNLIVAKTVLARICDKLDAGRVFGYGALVPNSAHMFLYSIDVGYYDNLYQSENNTPVHCPNVPHAKVTLLTGVARSISMNHAFVLSDTELPFDSEIELLGPNVRADYLAKLHGTTTANILRLG